MRFFNIILVAVLFLGSCSFDTKQDGTIAEDLSPKAFNELIQKNEGVVLDVRYMEEYVEGHIPNAVFANINGEEFEVEVAKLDKEKPVFVYCKLGGRSSKAQKILIGQGFKEVYNLNGGISAWIKDGLEVEK